MPIGGAYGKRADIHGSTCGRRGECDGWPAEQRTKPPLARTTDCHVYEEAEPVRREQWPARTCSAQAIGQSFSTSETGKRKRKWHSFSGTKREAQIERSRIVKEFAQGSYVEPSKTTLAAFPVAHAD